MEETEVEEFIGVVLIVRRTENETHEKIFRLFGTIFFASKLISGMT